MTRTDTLRAISSVCRKSHSAALLALGWILLEESTETLESLLLALQETDQHQELLSHIERFSELSAERWGGSSRLS